MSLGALASSLEKRVLRPVLEYANVLIGGLATTKFMREGKEELGKPNKTDTLRRMTGRLARSLTGAREVRVGFQDEALSEIKLTDGKAVLRKGTKVPYAALHEQGATMQIKAHTRKVAARKQRDAEKPVVRLVQVSAHSRTVKARPFLGPATRQAYPQVIARMKGLLKGWASAGTKILQRESGGSE